MKIIEKLELKTFDINAHLLRGVNFYKSIVDYRERIFPKLKHKIKSDDQFECPLCKGSAKSELMQWKQVYKLFECQNCGAVSPNIDNSGEDYIDSVYEVEEYKEKFIRETHSQYDYRKNNFGRERFKYTIDRLGLDKNSNVLDLGCGAGYYIGTLHDAKIQYKGLEVVDHLVDYCKLQHGLNVEKTDLEDEKDGSYDLVTMFDVLEHLSDPIETLNTVNKKLKPGGYCVAYTPNIFSIGYELMGVRQNTMLPFEHLCFVTQGSLQHLAKNTGFKIDKVETFGLDIMDYLLMKEYEDDIEYSNKLHDMMVLVQSVLDKQKGSNHFRITFKKQ